jgi:hypothetical protein
MNGIITLTVKARVGGKTVDAIITNDWQTYAVVPRDISVPAPAANFRLIMLDEGNKYVSVPSPWEILSVAPAS